MMSKNKYSQTKTQKINEKKTWVQPLLTDINIRLIKQQEEELFLQMLGDPEIFQRLAGSGGSDGR